MALNARRPLFVFGTLRDIALLECVAGSAITTTDAQLAGFRVATALGQSYPVLVPDDASKAVGLVLQDLSETQMARLDYYEAPYDYHRIPVDVATVGGVVAAEVYVPQGPVSAEGADWSLTAWQDENGPVMREAAVEIMDGFGHVDPVDIARRFQVIRTRAQQRVNAAAVASPTVLRLPHNKNDVQLIDKKQPYSHFFALNDVTVTTRQFGGGVSDHIERAVFVTADAVTVLPYDPVRDRVLLIEQFRAGVYVRGDQNPWSLEVIAGRQDPGETLEHAVRREAMEEAGLDIGALHKVASYYSSPGATTEYLNSYIGLADLPDGIEGVGGLDSEAEDIRSMLVSFDTLMAAVDSGEAENAPLILSALWLARKRDGFRATSG